MKRKINVIMVSAVVALAISGCGSSKKEETTKKESTTVVETTTANAETTTIEETTEEETVAEKKVITDKNFVVGEDGTDLIEYKGNDSVVEIPDGIEKINGAFVDNDKIEKIILPDSVKEIYAYSFKNLKNLKEVVFGQSIDFIEGGAFSKCPGIEEVVIPKGMNGIHYGAFGGCENLKKITVEEGSENYVVDNEALFSKDMKTLLLYPVKCDKYKKFEIPESVSVIFDDAFADNEFIEELVVKCDVVDGCDEGGSCQNMKSLKSVVFETAQTNKHPIIFAGCKKLESVVLADGTKYIGFGQFKDCKNLSKINFPSSLEGIGEDAFEGCSESITSKIDKSLIKTEWTE